MAWCEFCLTEYREGITQCADCGSTLVEEDKLPIPEPAPGGMKVALWEDSPPWPKDDAGKLIAPAKLQYVSDHVAYTMLTSFLRAYGIPFHSEALGSAYFSPVLTGGMAMGSTIFVPVTQLEEAKELLNAQME